MHRGAKNIMGEGGWGFVSLKAEEFKRGSIA